MSNRKQPFRLLPRPCWHWLKWGGTFHSATDGTFQTDTDGTNHSDIPGTFESDMGGTFNPLLSTESTCYVEARKYRTLKEFRTQSASCYGVARTQGWLSRYTWLKKGDGTPKKVGQYSMDGTLVAIYPSIAEACNGTGFNMSCVSTCCNGKRKSSKGYIWRFIDEQDV